MSPPLLAESLPYGDGAYKVYGMENFGNTCYCNSILQCLYFTTKFRHAILKHAPQTRERRTTLTGASIHSFTAKYEGLLAKKLKEQKRPTAEVAPPPGTAGQPTKPSIRNSLFGKFSTNLAPVLNSEDLTFMEQLKKRGYVYDALHCEALSMEQKLMIQKHPQLHCLEILVTRPLMAEADNSRADTNSASSTALLDSKTAANGSSSASSTSTANTVFSLVDAGPITSTSCLVVVGIPQPEQNLVNPVNPFNANPSSDHRKRSALINGPVLNLDHSLVEDRAPETVMLYALKDIFEAMAENKSDFGVVSPLYFITKLKEKNFLFRQANMHHDAHEFCNYLINEILESLNSESGSTDSFCTDLFRGLITNETKCLSCETATSREETFLDLSIDIPSGQSAYSLTNSLNNFSKLEVLHHQNKFYCNTCLSLQEAVKTIKLKKTPEILIVNFKRFKYDEKIDSMVKLFDSILYPLKLRLFNTSSSDEEHFSLYGLYALVVHIGGGPMHGHYVALCKCATGLWYLFDDETVELVNESYVLRFFGNGPGLATAYILFYEKLDTKDYDDNVDFGIDLKAVYNGSDYLFTVHDPVVASTTSSFPPDDVNLQDSAGSIKNFIPEASVSLENSVGSIGRKTSIFKKAFMFDNPENISKTVSRSSSITEYPAQESSAVGPKVPKPEKKSWVNGLKRRELRVEIGVPDRKGSLGSIKTGGSTDKEDTPRRRSSIFSFKKKDKKTEK